MKQSFYICFTDYLYIYCKLRIIFYNNVVICVSTGDLNNISSTNFVVTMQRFLIYIM